MIRFKLLCLLLLAAALGSCQKDPADDSAVDKAKITLSLGTRAVNSDDNAVGNELTIVSAYVYIFNAGGYLENAGEVKVPIDTSTGEAVDNANKLNRTWSVLRGQKNIYVLINPGKLLFPDGSQPNLESYDFTEAQLRSLCNDPASFDTEFSFESDGMLMSGKVEVNVSTASQTVTVPVARRYAFIQLGIKKKSDIPRGVLITLNKVTLVSQNTCDYAFAEQGNLKTLRRVEEGQGQYGTSITTEGIRALECYTMPQTGLTEAVRFDLDITYDGKNMILPVYINSGALDGNTANDRNKPLNIEANTIYKVSATITQKDVDVELDIKDWGDVDVAGDIFGSWISLSSDRVVMDWWNLGQRFDTSVDYTSDGNVSFLGYVVDGNLTADGSNLPAWLPKANITGLPDGTSKSGRIGMKYEVVEGTPNMAGTRIDYRSVSLRLKTGNIVKDICIQYDNGFIPRERLQAMGWNANLPDAGVQLADRSHRNSVYWADPSLTDRATVTGAEHSGYGWGPANTVAVAEQIGSTSVPALCQQCGTGFYCPSTEEMLVIQKCYAIVGPSYQMEFGSFTSTAVTSGTRVTVYYVDDRNNGYLPYDFYTTSYSSGFGSTSMPYVPVVNITERHRLTLQTEPASIADVVLRGDGVHGSGEMVPIGVENSNDAYTFVKWVDSDGTLFSADASAAFSMPQKDLTLKAVFTQKEWQPEMSGWAQGDLVIKELPDGQVQLALGTATDRGPAFTWGGLVGYDIKNGAVLFKPEEYTGTTTFTATPRVRVSCDGNKNTNHLLANHDPEAGTGDICVYASRKWPENFNHQLWRMPTEVELSQMVGHQVHTGNPASFETPYGTVSFYMFGYILYGGIYGTPVYNYTAGSFGPRWTASGCDDSRGPTGANSGKPCAFVVAMDTGRAYNNYAWGRTSAFPVRCVVDK